MFVDIVGDWCLCVSSCVVCVVSCGVRACSIALMMNDADEMF